MKKKWLGIIIVLLVCLCSGLVIHNRSLSTDKRRLSQNQQALMDKVELYKTEAGNSAASVQRLELSYSELSNNYDEICKVADDLKVKLKRIKSASATSTKTEVEIRTIVKDSIVYVSGVLDSLKAISWSDPWVSVKGELRKDNLKLDVQSTDTLIQIVHRVPKKFLFIKYGTKAIRQEIVSKNPHTHIVYTDYLEVIK